VTAKTDGVIKTKRKPTGAAAMGAGPGRPKGAQNKVTSDIKAMVLAALEGAGGKDYLIERALDPRTAGAFLTLLGKVLPLQVTGAGGESLSLKVELVRPALTVIAQEATDGP